MAVGLTLKGFSRNHKPKQKYAEVNNAKPSGCHARSPSRSHLTSTTIPLLPSLQSFTMAESSLAADLLADFNDSDEEELDENGTSEISNDLSDQPNGNHSRSRDLMELDGDEESDDDEDEEMSGMLDGAKVKPKVTGDLSIDDDEETRKAKVESLQLADVDDVRSVAKLMKVLEPVLEVCYSLS